LIIDMPAYIAWQRLLMRCQHFTAILVTDAYRFRYHFAAHATHFDDLPHTIATE